jgi:hypothetical protein
MRVFRFALALLALPIAGGAEAAMCVDGRPSIGDEFRKAAFVVDAKLVQVERNVPFSYLYGGERIEERMDRLTFRLLHAYKGAPERLIRLDNPHDSAALPVEQGKAYLLFINRREPGGDLYIDTCGVSNPLPYVSRQTRNSVRKLGRKAG